MRIEDASAEVHNAQGRMRRDGAFRTMQDMCHTFAWQPKFTQTLETLHGEEFERMARMVMDYGTYGIEPSLSATYELMYFRMVRDDIDNSIRAREKNKGGRPSKDGKSPGKTPVSDIETPVSKVETPVRKDETGVGTNETHTSSNQYKPIQSKPSGNHATTRCPLCGGKLYKNHQTGKYECDTCFNSFPLSKLVNQQVQSRE